MASNIITAALLALGAVGGARSSRATTFGAVGSVALDAGEVAGTGNTTISGRRGRGTQITRSAGGRRSVRS